MPTADDDLRQQMIDRFGSIDTHGPQRFLQDAGYTLARGWIWLPKPGVTTVGQMTREEFDCLLFLIHEWDYGSLATPSDTPAP